MIRRLKIGHRLVIAFVFIVLMMLIASGIGLWQLDMTRIQAQRLHLADLRVIAIIRIHNDILSVIDQLEPLAEREDTQAFVGEAQSWQARINEGVPRATVTILTSYAGESPTPDEELNELEAIQTAMSAQLDELMNLALVDDWEGVRTRFDTELIATSERTETLVERIREEVAVEQAQAREQLNEVQTTAFWTFTLTGMLMLFMAILLGVTITRSISQPLSRLDRAAKALARGYFNYQVPVEGNDELTHLGQAFNDASGQLSQLYADLEEMVLLRTHELQRRALQLETSAAVSQRVTSILDQNTLLKQVADLIKMQFEYGYVAIFLVDETGTSLEPQTTAVAPDILGVVSGQGQLGNRFAIGQGTAMGIAAGRRQVLQIDNATDYRIRNDGKAAHLLPQMESELVLPLVVGEKLLGVIDIQSRRQGVFTQEEVPVLQALADQVAIAIQNAKRYQEEEKRRQLAEVMQQIGGALSGTLKFNEVLDLILDYLAVMIPYDRAAVLLHRDSYLEIVAAKGFPADSNPTQITVPLDESNEEDVFLKIYRTKRPLFISDVADSEGWQHVEGLPRTRGWLGLPLIYENEVTGMLSIVRETASNFHEEEVSLATTFTAQAAIALQNARLYNRVQGFNQQLEETVAMRTEALEDAISRLERLDRAKSDFIKVISHELRTPLTLLQGYSAMLLADPFITDSEHHVEMVSGIEHGTHRMHEVINDMLDMVKIDNDTFTLHLESISLAPIIKEIISKLKPALAERQQTISVTGVDELPVIRGDLDSMRKLFYHLIVNAIKYTPDGGEIRVNGRYLPPSENNKQEFLELIVSDTGIGIDSDFHDLIFSKFYQTGKVALHSTGKTKFKGGGPGLGLAIAQGIVTMHNGEIWVESEGHNEEKMPGSHFHVLLPLQTKDSPAGRDATPFTEFMAVH